ncbi:hypothetical protein PHMEG_00028161 [Phytophthora megakarya]|uniref:Secreted protein n=1 Tax=Phytophthora megakarya TaxID=4795 RepID=A0A225V6K9_9STRA|nr:hypothetical protein PHMEG_00028161 [Phytophthora megakarya]
MHVKSVCCCFVTGVFGSKFVTCVTITAQSMSLASVNRQVIAASSANARVAAVASASFTWSYAAHSSVVSSNLIPAAARFVRLVDTSAESSRCWRSTTLRAKSTMLSRIQLIAHTNC